MSIIIKLDDKLGEFTFIANSSFSAIREIISEHSDDAKLHYILEVAQYNNFLDLRKLTMAQREVLAAGVARYRELPLQIEMEPQAIALRDENIGKVHKYILTGVIE